jgi:hypothetical protein
MARKLKPGETIGKLREAEIVLAQGAVGLRLAFRTPIRVHQKQTRSQ